MEEYSHIPQMQSDFEQIKRHTENGQEYWSSRELCSAMGYSSYQKFGRLLGKALEVAHSKAM